MGVNGRRYDVAVVIGLVAMSSVVGGQALSESLYENKTIRMVIAQDAGGSYDLVARLVGRHIGKYIAGQPPVIPQNMSGASGISATNHIYNIAPQDGTILGAVHPVSASLSAMLGNPNARYVPNKFQWIGTLADPTNVVVVWHESAVKSWQDATRITATIGAVSADGADAMSGNLANGTLGTKFKVVTGYKGGSDIVLAMERGEADGRGMQTWAGWKAVKPDWVAQKKIIPLYQIALQPDPDPGLAGVPLLVDLVAGEENKGAVRLFTNVMALGRPMLVGPGVPAANVAELRRAYAATVADPEFIEEAKKLRLELAPVTGEKVQGIIDEMMAMNPAIINRFREAAQVP